MANLWSAAEKSLPHVSRNDYTYVFQDENDAALVPSYRWVDLSNRQKITSSTDFRDIYKLNVTTGIGDTNGGIMRWGRLWLRT